jgi:prepilin-type processing-associated H-X9-DG protein
MPCVRYVDINQQATARSLHPGGVNVALLDGSARFISDYIDPGLWHVIHSRETPPQAVRGVDISSAEFMALAPLSATKANASLAAAPVAALPSHFRNSLGMEFIFVPAGEFTMGLPDDGSIDPIPAECPPHRVELTEPYWLAQHEVTRRDFAKVMREDDLAAAGMGLFPMTNITWDEAMTFCQRLSGRPLETAAHRRYRLPTEAEWEYACRRHAPAQNSHDRVSAQGTSVQLHPIDVQDQAISANQICDLRGNAWEWTADWFARDYYARSPLSDPAGPETGYLKVVRGTAWRFSGEPCRIDYAVQAPWKRNPFVGFRVVCEVSGGR